MNAMNDMARRVTVAHHVCELVERQRHRLRHFYGTDENVDVVRLGLLVRDVGDAADTFTYGTDSMYERVAAIAADAQEWLEDMQRQAAR